MAVPSTIADLSTTAASNSPSGSDSPNTIDDHIRAVSAIVKQNASRGSDIASTSTITIPDSGSYFAVTGTTTISGINDSWNGRVVLLKFSGALTLTNSASLILFGSNITTAAGNTLIIANESAGVWRAIAFTNGSTVTTTGTQSLTNKTIVAASNTITTAASGNLTATELNAALAELQADIDARSLTAGVSAGNVVQVDQSLTATTRSATTTLGTTLNHTLSDTSTTITAFNGVAGVTYHCRALGAGNITHHATNLIITQTGADITTAADDTFDVEMITGTTCRLKNYQRASGEALTGVNEKLAGDTVQVVAYQTGAVATGTGTIPSDDTIPQNTEGDEYMTLAITPTSATNKLRIDVTLQVANSNTASVIYGALFQDSTADAIASSFGGRNATAGAQVEISFTHYMTAGTTSSTTFKVRAGSFLAGTTTLNGLAGSRIHGGVMASSIIISEIQV